MQRSNPPVRAYSEGTGRLKKKKRSVGETCCYGLGTAVAAAQLLKASPCARQAAELKGRPGRGDAMGDLNLGATGDLNPGDMRETPAAAVRVLR